MDYLLAGAGLVLGPSLRNMPIPSDAQAAWVPLGLGVIYLLYMMVVVRRGFGWQPAVLVGLMIVLSPAWHRVFRNRPPGSSLPYCPAAALCGRGLDSRGRCG